MKRYHRMKKAEAHLNEHKQSPFMTYIKEVVYGGIDGIITTFAVVAGFSGAAFSNDATTQLSFFLVLLFGLANLFADGVSMGLGNFLAVRAEQSLYASVRKKEECLSIQNEKGERELTRQTLIARGFSPADAETLTAIYEKNEPYWVDFIMTNELKFQDPSGTSPLITGAVTFLSFISFGCIPLVPFILFGDKSPETVFVFSGVAAGIALVLLGVFKWRVVGMHPVRSILEIVFVGGMAAFVAFVVGTLFTF